MDERPNDYTPPTYWTCPLCECGFNEKPEDACPACGSKLAVLPTASADVVVRKGKK